MGASVIHYAGAGVGIATSSYGAAVATTTVGLATGVATAGIGFAAVLVSLWAGHEARVKGATAENQILNSAVPTVAQAITQIFAAANQGQITADEAIGYLAQTQQKYWQTVSQYVGAPGTAAVPCGPITDTSPAFPDHYPNPCNKQCTASCCVGCNDINQWIYKASRIFQNGGIDPTTYDWMPVSGSPKYGFNGFVPDTSTWHYMPPQYAVPANQQTAVQQAVANVAPAAASNPALGYVGAAPTVYPIAANGFSSTELLILLALGAGVILLLR